MYAIKNEEEDRLFIERSALIKKMRPSDVMIYLGIKEKFIINEPLNFENTWRIDLYYHYSWYWAS